MTREQALAKAREAAGRAGRLADHAEQASHSTTRDHLTGHYAAAGAAWADTARAYAAIAAATPEPQPTSNDTPEV